VLAAPSVIDLFLEEESQALAMLSDFIGKPISLHAEAATRRSSSTSF
jgi:ribonuclease G